MCSGPRMPDITNAHGAAHSPNPRYMLPQGVGERSEESPKVIAMPIDTNNTHANAAAFIGPTTLTGRNVSPQIPRAEPRPDGAGLPQPCREPVRCFPWTDGFTLALLLLLLY